jgi:hypothetical protein
VVKFPGQQRGWLRPTDFDAPRLFTCGGEPLPCRRPTPDVVIEAVMYSVRKRGIGALSEPDTIERLQRCDAYARTEINKRIDALAARRECA